MSEVLGFVVLALCAASMVSKFAAGIRDTYDRRRAFAAAERVAARLAIEHWRRSMPMPSQLLDEPSAIEATFDALRVMARRLRKVWRHAFCLAMHGGHELYRARSDNRLFQQCLLCGYETTGWTIDRRDRRLHLVSANSSNKYSKAS